MRGNAAYYFAKAPGDEHGCRLRIAFTPTAATVAGVSGFTEDCMFGGNMTADGTYQRVSRRVPTHVISGEGDTLRFAHLPPELLQDNQIRPTHNPEQPALTAYDCCHPFRHGLIFGWK